MRLRIQLLWLIGICFLCSKAYCQRDWLKISYRNTVSGYYNPHEPHIHLDVVLDSLFFISSSTFFSNVFGNELTVYKSSDEAINWHHVFYDTGHGVNGRIKALKKDSIFKMHINTIGGYFIHLSIDEGESWEIYRNLQISNWASLKVSDFYLVNVNTFYFIRDNKINQVLADTIIDVFHSDTISLGTLAFKGSHGYGICGIPGENAIMKSEDFGKNWYIQFSSPDIDLIGISLLTESIGYISCNNGQVLKTTNHGMDWELIQTQVTEDLNVIYFRDENNGFCASKDGIILETKDGGLSWDLDSTFFENNPFYPVISEIYKSSSGNVFTVVNSVLYAKYLDLFSNLPESYNYYPVPCGDRLYFERQKYNYPLEYRIFNAQGQLMTKDSWGNVTTTGQNYLDMSRLSSGLYFIYTKTTVKEYFDRIIKY